MSLANQHGRLASLGFVRYATGLFRCELEHYTIDALVRSESQLVVCFDHAGIAESQPSRDRLGWGLGFVLNHTDKSGLFIKPTESNWFRKPGLYKLFEQLEKSGFIGVYDSIITYGGSMGGYAAIAYADALHAEKVLSLNPQATLDAAIVPWETRFPRGMRQDWSSFPQNAAEGCQNASEVVVVFDRLCQKDARHAALLNIPGRVELNVPFVGHGIPYHLRKMGLLERLFDDVASGAFSLSEWHRLIRMRRLLDEYRNVIDKKCAARASRSDQQDP